MIKILKSFFSENYGPRDELQVIFDAFTDSVIVYDSQRIIVTANHPAIEYLRFNPVGLSVAEYTAKNESCFPDVMTGAGGSILQLALQGDTVKDVPASTVDRAGVERFYTCSAAPIRDNKIVAGAVLVWHDVTGSRKIELQLQVFNKKLDERITQISEKQILSEKQIEHDKTEIDTKDSQIMVSNKLLEIVFSNTHFLIAYLTTDFTIIQVNDAYAKAFGRTPEYFTGKNHFEIFPHEGNRAVFAKVVETGLSHVTYAEPFFHPGKPMAQTGTTFWDWSLQPIINRRKVEGIILVLIDVTRRKKAEEELFNAKRLSDIGTLAATVAHELRNPLGVIQAAIYNIEKKGRGIDIEKHIKNINGKIEESELIINNLLSYSKLKIPNRSEIHIYGFLNDLLGDIMSKNVMQDAALIKNYNNLKDVVIGIDPVQIREVLNNILNNAYQSLPPLSGRIEIFGSLGNSHYLTLRVTDNGDGIEQGDLNKIFEPFFTNRSRGTGLGLTICKELIKLHNGDIEIRSKKGEGTTVIITLPLTGAA